MRASLLALLVGGCCVSFAFYGRCDTAFAAERRRRLAQVKAGVPLDQVKAQPFQNPATSVAAWRMWQHPAFRFRHAGAVWYLVLGSSALLVAMAIVSHRQSR